ncbi:hypothetical protein F3K34_43635 [Streptomyces sp. LBUM 1486]|uniref:hypothetical protein n=1 Tax=Streptomyces scabiei TaxID=1930 RepID=UPI001B341C4D|nr:MULTISPECIES: hypothetical protein [Streptomyces]MBP5918679.1 hypothetical protein [Streptomyces sp. LBUM 1486]MDX2800199.1 hypothetical protein [Streptomyces scabiei]MDX3124544.1 hypothetical protein [Streptomyces scabiei]MDX3283279.1 hypothetical protein [Streptomyces scabiei]
MADVHIKLSDGVREVSVELSGADGLVLKQAEAAALRLFDIASKTSSPAHRAGFSSWALSSDTERSPEE